MGNVTRVNSANIYVENTDFVTTTGSVGSVLTVASATGTYNGGDVTCFDHVGAIFFAAFTSINATATVRVNLQYKDPLSLIYVNVAGISMDAMSASAVGVPQIIHLYPGLLATLSSFAGGTSSENQFNITVARTMRVQASITTQATATTVATAFKISMTKLL